jgi:transposase
MQGKPAMKEAREILRLITAGVSDRRIAQVVNLARSTVARVRVRAQAAGIVWPQAATLSEAVLMQALFERGGASAHRGARRRTEPDWAALHLELKRPHVTLMLLWEEYRAAVGEQAYGYSRFCELYHAFAARLSPSMRQSHAVGDKMFVDYAGATVPVVVDRHTGETRSAQIFVAVLGASNLTYAEASWTQSSADWVNAHVHALDYFGGAPNLVVADNLKAAIVKACRYDPGVNRTYGDFAAHYGMGVLATRVRKPKDKAKVEVGVQIVERWILARLRHARFTSLGALNGAIRTLLDELNTRSMRKLGTTRRALFEAVEKNALRPLPVEPYVFAEWKIRRVSLDYHVDVDGHYYSVPHRFLREKVEVRLAARSVEIFHGGERIAAHMREGGAGRHTTQPDHMPEHHRTLAGWTIDKIRADADRIGPATAMLVGRIFEERRHREQGIRACLGILRLERHYGGARLEAACLRGLDIGVRTYGSIRSILENKLDQHAPLKRGQDAGAPIVHPNLRGPRYYN